MPRTVRPARSYATDPVTRALRILAILAVAAIAAWMLAQYPALPETVPTHFDAAGRPDGWGSKSSVLWLALVMAALTALLAWLSTKPRWANYPVQLTEQNAQRVYREGERMLVWMLWPIALLFAGLALLTVGSASAMVGAILPGQVALALGFAGMLVVVTVGIVRLVRAAR
ncbi:DUF1648 domain-containing protein [Agrococcus sp. Ld7]|uniref:DUF1648 domain-containing protein n=1 Tax=Agrococcus sp. Ld7 TaxID=649148 RepID=UPI003868D2DE